MQLTDFPHPYPSLKGVSKEIIKYERKDGVQLTGNLYLPPGYAPERDGPLPLIMWAYPREYKSKDAAGQVSSVKPCSWLITVQNPAGCTPEQERLRILYGRCRGCAASPEF